MIDFSKVYCKVHPYQLVTNFCWKQECLTGLCATCVCSHTDTHLKNNKIPEYQNIRTTFTEMHRKVRKEIDILESDKDRVNQFANKLEGNRRKVKETINQVKGDCIDLVNSHFAKLEKDLEQQINQEDAKVGLHSQFRLESLITYLSKEIQNLINSAQELTSVNFLDCVKRVQREKLVNSNKVHEEINKELRENEKYKFSVEINEAAFKEVKISLQKMLSLEFTYPSQHVLEVLDANKETSPLYEGDDIESRETITCRDLPSWNFEASNQRGDDRNLAQKNNSTVYIHPLAQSLGPNLMATNVSGFQKMNNLSMAMDTLPTRYAVSQPQTPTLKINRQKIPYQFVAHRPQTPEPFRNHSIMIDKPSVHQIPTNRSIVINPAIRTNNFVRSNDNFMQNPNGLIRNSSTMALQNLNYSNSNSTMKFVPQYVDLNQVRVQKNDNSVSKRINSKKAGLSLLSQNVGQKENRSAQAL